MASLEGIRSPFSAQPSARSPKLRIYEHLFLWNQGVDHVVALLHDMEKFPFSDKESVQSAVAEVEEVRCDMNADFIEHLADSGTPLRRSGESPTTSISTSSAARKNARSRDCRHVSALSLTPQSPKKNNAGKRSKSGRKSGTRSAGSKS